MAHVAYFFNSRDGDRIYNADSFGEWLKPFFTNGVFNGGLSVTANDNMTVTVALGTGFINGKAVVFDSAETFDLQVASGTLNRIDSVVLRRDDTQRDIYLTVLTGGNAITPVAPTIQRDNGIYDLKLADICIGKGVIKVMQENITDTRLDSSVCGFVATTIETVDTTTLFNQYLAWYNTFTATKDSEMLAWMESAFVRWNNDASVRLDEVMDALDEVTTNNGEWSPEKLKYKRYSIVTYPVNGKTVGFVALSDVPQGINPTNTTYWVPITLQGERGSDAVVTDISGHYAFQVRDGHLYCMYPDDTTAPNFSINEAGHLIFTIV